MHAHMLSSKAAHHHTAGKKLDIRIASTHDTHRHRQILPARSIHSKDTHQGEGFGVFVLARHLGPLDGLGGTERISLQPVPVEELVLLGVSSARRKPEQRYETVRQ